jgi:hypothetical protein
MRLDESCKVQCKLRLTAAQARDFKERIDDEYRITMCAPLELSALRRRLTPTAQDLGQPADGAGPSA